MEQRILLPLWPDAAFAIGVQRTKIYEMARHGELPGLVRIGRLLRVRRESLENWAKQQAELMDRQP